MTALLDDTHSIPVLTCRLSITSVLGEPTPLLPFVDTKHICGALTFMKTSTHMCKIKLKILKFHKIIKSVRTGYGDTLLNPALGRQGSKGLCEFMA